MRAVLPWGVFAAFSVTLVAVGRWLVNGAVALMEDMEAFDFDVSDETWETNADQ